jgi:transcriptional regulator with GAF, ATPase, and Fis domain
MRDDCSTWTMEGERGVELRSHKIRVEVIRGPMEGYVVKVPGPEATVGSSKDCNIVLEDPTVSRLHVVLRIEGDGIRVLDKGSRNGTTVDGVRVFDAYARPDSSIGLGASALRLRMVREVVSLPFSSRSSFGRLVGSSVSMRRVYAMLERIARSETTVLVEGETGTGKELAAEAIHKESGRADKPFVVFDCSAVGAGVIESELFGHERDAFTGARSRRIGRFEEADGGTLFLDEIGELPMELQPKLLRALEARQVTRMGSNRPISVNVRIVAATNRSLATEVDRGRFREDLYYRISVVPIRLPPLRERVDDIAMLVRHFEADWRRRGSTSPPISEEWLESCKWQPWPGNVRELRNKVDMMMSLGIGDHAQAEEESLPGNTSPAAGMVDLREPLHRAVDRVKEAFERSYLVAALKETGYNISRAAKLAGVGRAHIYKLMVKHEIQRPDDAVDVLDDEETRVDQNRGRQVHHAY